MAAASVAAFWVTALLLVMVPGADWAFVISSGLRGHSALPAVAGLVAGYAGITIVVAAGVGLVVARSPGLLAGLTLAGGLYLMWHGARTFARPAAAGPRPGGPAGPGRRGAARAVLIRGAGVSALNPKGLLLLLALLPQFTSPRWAWPLTVQLGFLGVVFMLTVAVFYLCLGSFARKVLHPRPAAARAVTRCSGAAMIVIGALLPAARFVHW
ncbi:MAG: LysE family translocator [Gemmatimonadota bacterium]